MLDSNKPAFDIAAAPRHVPAGIARRLLVGGVVNLVGWFFLALGLVFCWIFLRNSELRSHIDFAGHTDMAQGRVVAVEATSASENDERIHAIRYVYEVDGREHGGTSYALHDEFDIGETVSIEYVMSDPGISRIDGMRRYTFGAWVAFVLVFPLVGLGIVTVGLIRGRRKMRIMRHGRPALGTLVSRQASNVTINDQRVYELGFEFQDDDGYTHIARMRTTRPEAMADDARERLLYLPSKPPAIILMDELPGVHVAHDGRLVATSSGVLAMIPPVVCGLVVMVLAVLSLAG